MKGQGVRLPWACFKVLHFGCRCPHEGVRPSGNSCLISTAQVAFTSWRQITWLTSVSSFKCSERSLANLGFCARDVKAAASMAPMFKVDKLTLPPPLPCEFAKAAPLDDREMLLDARAMLRWQNTIA